MNGFPGPPGGGAEVLRDRPRRDPLRRSAFRLRVAARSASPSGPAERGPPRDPTRRLHPGPAERGPPRRSPGCRSRHQRAYRSSLRCRRSGRSRRTSSSARRATPRGATPRPPPPRRGPHPTGPRPASARTQRRRTPGSVRGTPPRRRPATPRRGPGARSASAPLRWWREKAAGSATTSTPRLSKARKTAGNRTS